MDMARSYTEFYKKKRKYLSEQVQQGTVKESDAEAIRELCDAFDEDRPTVNLPRWPDAQSNLTKYREQSTLANWTYHLTGYAKHTELLDTTADRINEIAQNLIGQRGHRQVKGENVRACVWNRNLTKGSVRAYQNTIRIFYRYHDIGIDHRDIAVFEQQDTSINPRDMLEPDEIDKVRDAPTHPRDKCIVDMLLYTGMRNRALRTLRIKDIDLDEGNFYFNTDENGLKNLDRPDAPRPLLGAKNAVRTWLEYHPDSDNPDAYLIMGKPKYGNPDSESVVSDRTIQRVMDSIKETAGIDKPLHPHAMRHNMVSMAKNVYDLDDSTVKFLIGHAPDSQVMETTYSHISAEDYQAKAERKMGIRDDEPESPLTPDFCDVCDEPLNPEHNVCPNCGTVYSHGAHTVKEQIEEDMYEDKSKLEGEEEEALDKMKELIKENPDIVDKLTD
jgi:integrase